MTIPGGHWKHVSVALDEIETFMNDNDIHAEAGDSNPDAMIWRTTTGNPLVIPLGLTTCEHGHVTVQLLLWQQDKAEKPRISLARPTGPINASRN